MRELKILNLIDSNSLGGPEKYILGYAKGLDDSIKIAVSTFGSDGSDSPFLSQSHALKKINSFVIPCAHSYDPKQITNLIALARRGEYDIINSHGYRADLIGLIASRVLSVPIVATFHGWTGSNSKVRFFDRIDRAVLKRMDHIITVSEANKRRLQQSGIEETKMTVVPNAIDPEEFLGLSRLGRPEMLREELGLSGDEKICICVGRLSFEKGQKVALQAFASTIKEIPECRLVFLGEGPEEGRLRKLGHELGVSNEVYFVGFRPNVIDYLKFSDRILLPSLTEGLPTVVLEAFLCSKLVIATSVGGTPEVVRDRETGILVPPNDPQSLSKAIIESFKDQKEMERIAQNACQVVMAHHTFEKHVVKMERVFRTL
ncbi:glycosyltransferase family 4 protein [Candidatus Manganitrophus noduliformans]|nr:glycosyltransferase family 4 protein [Candidatus Manganitrophus noduliformans]